MIRYTVLLLSTATLTSDASDNDCVVSRDRHIVFSYLQYYEELQTVCDSYIMMFL